MPRRGKLKRGKKKCTGNVAVCPTEANVSAQKHAPARRSKHQHNSLSSMPRRNKRQRNSLSSMQATALTRPALPTCRQSQTRLRIIVHFGLPRTEHAIVRNQQAQKPLKPSPSVGESDTFDDISHFLVLHHLCEALSVRIIVCFGRPWTERTVIRNQQVQKPLKPSPGVRELDIFDDGLQF